MHNTVLFCLESFSDLGPSTGSSVARKVVPRKPTKRSRTSTNITASPVPHTGASDDDGAGSYYATIGTRLHTKCLKGQVYMDVSPLCS